MVVSTHNTLYVVLAKDIGYLVPVIHVTIAQRIVGKDKNRCVARSSNAIQIMLKPCDILRCDMSVSHTNDWSRVESDKEDTIMGESKSTIAKDTAEIHDARLGPCSLVITRSNIVGYLELV